MSAQASGRLIDSSSEAQMEPVPPVLLLRMPAVIKRTGLGRTTIYKLIHEKRFPKPVMLSKRAVAWSAAEVQRWIANLEHTK